MAESEVYGFYEGTQESKDFNYIVVTNKENAIQGDIFYKDFVVGKWDDGSPYFEVTVQNKIGQTCTGRYSLPKPQPTKKNDDPKGKILAILKNFTTKVLGDKVKMEGKSLEDLFEKTATAIKAKAGWDKINLTTVFINDDKGFTKLRKFSPVVELTSDKEAVAKLQLAPFELDSFQSKQTPSQETSNVNAGAEPEIF
jgi:hypothetical protein